jgi:integrase
MYGGGLRVGEACAVRVMDIGLDRLQLVVRRGKGDKDRVKPLPERLVDELRALIDARRTRRMPKREKAASSFRSPSIACRLGSRGVGSGSICLPSAELSVDPVSG